jgi:hypothetical protein
MLSVGYSDKNILHMTLVAYAHCANMHAEYVAGGTFLQPPPWKCGLLGAAHLAPWQLTQPLLLQWVFTITL